MKVSNGQASWWEQRKGHRATIQIDRYQCIQGNSDTVAQGKKPVCPNCKKKKMRAVIEIEQLGLFSSTFNSVFRCQNPECDTLAVYNYEIFYDQGLEVIEK